MVACGLVSRTAVHNTPCMDPVASSEHRDDVLARGEVHGKHKLGIDVRDVLSMCSLAPWFNPIHLTTSITPFDPRSETWSPPRVTTLPSRYQLARSPFYGFRNPAPALL